MYYLPPYSPFINAIEYAFNVLKMNVQQKEFRGTQELEAAINAAIPEITAVQAAGFYDKAQSYWEQCKLAPLSEEASEEPTTPPAHGGAASVRA